MHTIDNFTRTGNWQLHHSTRFLLMGNQKSGEGEWVDIPCIWDEWTPFHRFAQS